MPQMFDYLSEKYQQSSVDEVNRRLLELSSLFEIAQLLNESLELKSVLNNILYIPMGRLMIARGAILLARDGGLRVEMGKGLPADLNGRYLEIDNPGELPRGLFPVSGEADETVPASLRDFATAARLDVAIPFRGPGSVLGLLVFGAKLNGQPFSQEERDFLHSLANLSATAITNALQLDEIKQVNRRLDAKIQELRTLFDIGQGLSATLDFQKILKLLVYALMGQMLITRYAILLHNDTHLRTLEAKGFERDVLDTLADRLWQAPSDSGASRTEELSDTRLRKLLDDHGARCLIPMQHQDKRLGYVIVGAKISGDGFEDTDLEFLTTLVSQAVISLENARLFQETLEKQRLEEELNLARNIQKKLLPKSIPDLPGYDIHGMNQSSKQVGGDYFDVIPVDENRVALAIGDVSGKGVPASLLMANLQAALRVVITPDVDLARAVARLNTLVHANTDLDKFITFFIGIIDTRTHTFTYVNAGHNNPHFYHDGVRKELDIGGLLLGILPEYQYETGEITLAPGDVVLTYTDGVNEAMSPDGEEFGDERLNALTAELHTRPMKEMVEAIYSAIDRFADGKTQADDVTMLGIRRLP